MSAAYVYSAIFLDPAQYKHKTTCVRKDDLPSKGIKNMGNDIVVQGYRWLISVNPPIRVIHRVPVHVWQRSREVMVMV
jgi:hypothetical protein